MIELTLISMRATGNYVYNRIRTKHGKNAYFTAMSKCIELVSLCDDLHHTLYRIDHQVMVEADNLYPKRFFLGNEESRYYKMACKHAIDVIESLEKRFVTGGYSRFPIISGGWEYEDKSVF